MPKVSISKSKIAIDRKKVDLISGEVHYWRLNPSNWQACLDAVKEMGLDTIATYVPWDYHEYQKGSFDFEGKTDPARDLRSFLKLAKKNKLWVIIRPGPYIYSEWQRDGVPAYAYQYHRLHPKFLQYAETYMKEVCEIIRPFLATKKDGNIILFQSDNEIDPWPDVFGYQYGFGKKPGMFQDFIEKKYDGDISSLNTSWQTNYKTFKEVGPYIIKELKGDKALKRNLDFYDFMHFYSKEVAKWGVETYRRLGIDVPIYLNTYPFFYAHSWSEFEEQCDLAGIDLYPENEFHEAPQDQRKFMDKIRYTRTFSSLPYIAEFASGVWHYRHYETGVLTPEHYRLISISALMAGIKGWNWYMLVNRDNWYMSPINEWGRKRGELFDAFCSIVKMYKGMDPASCEKITDVSVVFNPRQHAAQTIRLEEKTLEALYDANIDYEVLDPATGQINKKVLFYAGNQWLSEEKQKNLRDYIQKGGTFICFWEYPRMDENFEPCNLLGLQDPDKTLFKFKTSLPLTFPDGAATTTVSTLAVFNEVEGKPITTKMLNWGKMTVGYIRKVGKGKVVHLAVQPSKELIHFLLSYIGITPSVICSDKYIQTALFKRGSKYYLPVTNNGNEERKAVIKLPELLKKKKNWRVTRLDARQEIRFVASKEVNLTVTLPQKDGTVLELS